MSANKTGKFRCAVICASDKGFAGEREDTSGPLMCDLAREEGFEIIHFVLLPDDKEGLVAEIAKICDGNIADLLLTTGGTGLSARDQMPEATLEAADKAVPGIAEALRAFSMQKTPRAMFSRGVAAVRGKTLIVNMPGSPRAVEECVRYLLPNLEHALDMLTVDSGECART
ncbi:MAG: MogA/MoaB family molybdenum cofactor biosynthesis protein [Oscillospiraceae bacterium]